MRSAPLVYTAGPTSHEPGPIAGRSALGEATLEQTRLEPPALHPSQPMQYDAAQSAPWRLWVRVDAGRSAHSFRLAPMGPPARSGRQSICHRAGSDTAAQLPGRRTLRSLPALPGRSEDAEASVRWANRRKRRAPAWPQQDEVARVGGATKSALWYISHPVQLYFWELWRLQTHRIQVLRQPLLDDLVFGNQRRFPARLHDRRGDERGGATHLLGRARLVASWHSEAATHQRCIRRRSRTSGTISYHFTTKAYRFHDRGSDTS